MQPTSFRLNIRRALVSCAGLLLLAAAAWPQSASTWTIDTFAGTLPGPEGRATQAFLEDPSDVAVDNEGNILVADDGFGFPWVRKVSPDGRISLFAGSGEPGYDGDGGPAAEAKLESAGSVTVDPNTGDAYIADGYVVRKVSLDGSISTFAGNDRHRPRERVPTPVGVPKLQFPLGRVNIVEFDPRSGRLYVLADGRWIWRIENGRVFYHGGSEVYGYAGDGGQPRRAQFSSVGDLAVAPDGSLYVADTYNHRIRLIDPASSIITTAIGTGTLNFRLIPDGAAVSETDIGPPEALAFDMEGNLHYADFYGRIYRVDRNRERIDLVVDIRMLARRFLRFEAMALQPDGTFLLASRGVGRTEILAWSPEGGLRTIAGGSTRRGDYGPARQAWLHSPADVAFDGDGSLLIADSSNFLIRTVSTTDYVSSLDVGFVTRMTSDRSGGVVFSEFSAIHLVRPGNGVDTLLRVGRQARTRTRLRSLAVDPAGRIHFVEERSGTIHRLEREGPPTRVAGNNTGRHSGDGGPALEAGFYSVDDIAFDHSGNLYVADDRSFLIRRIDAVTGTIQTVVRGSRGLGSGSKAAPNVRAELLRPNRIAFGPGPAPELFLASTFANRIQRIYMPESADPSHGIGEGALVETIAGTGAEGFSGDGGPATDARLWGPDGMAFGPDGKLYFADRYNHRIRVLTREATSP